MDWLLGLSFVLKVGTLVKGETLQKAALAGPFKSADFRHLWSASIVGNLGTLVQAVGAGWLMVTISDSVQMVALVQSAATLPLMVLSLATGALADSFDRRRVMLVAQCLMMIASLALAILTFLGLMTPWLLLGFTFLLGSGMALYNPSWQASIGDIVDKQDIPQAVVLNGMAMNLTRSVGPALGGMIVAAVGAAGAFTFNAVTYIMPIIALYRWKSPKSTSTLPREALGSAVVAGVRYVAMSPNIIKVIIRSGLFGLGGVSILALMPLIARDLVGGDAITFGLLLGSFGIGAVGSALSSTRIRQAFNGELITRYSCLLVAFSLVGVAVSRELWLTALCLLPIGASWVLALSLFNVTVQLSTPRWVVGRALSILQMSTFGGLTIGGWAWGVVAGNVGASGALLGAGAVMVFCAAVGLVVALPEASALNFDPSNRFKEPDLKLEIRPRSGPIVVLIDYEIELEEVQAFLALMALRRQRRIRDSARHWSLLRDLENPKIWTETYQVSTWSEYVRHNLRHTQGDSEVSDKINALNVDPNGPHVHRMIQRQTVSAHDDIPIKHYTYVP